MEVVFLLLVVCWSPVVAQVSVPQRDEVRTETGTEEGGRADVPSDPVVLWDELQGLKDLVLSLKAAEVGRRQTLRSVESRLRDREMEAEQQRRSVDGLTETLNQNRKELRSATQRAEADRKLEMDANSELSRKVEELEEQNKALAAELPFLQTRLRASELTVEQLRRRSSVLAVRLCNTEGLMKELRRQSSAAFASNSSTVSEEPISNSPDRGSLSAVNIPQTSGVNSSGSCELRLRGFEEQLENLKNVNSVQEGALSAVTVRLNMSEEQLDHLRTTNTELQVRLRVTEVTVEQLQTDSQAHSVLLSELTSRLESSERNGSELTFRQNINTKQLEELRNADSELETRLSEGEKHLEELRMVNAELRAALSVGEKHLEELKTETTELETRLSVSEEQLEELKSENEELEARQSVSENQLEELKSENTELKIRLSVNKKQLEDLKTENTELETRQSVGEEQLEDLKTAKKELETRQSVNMKQLEDFRRVNTERETRLNISEKQLEDLNTEVTELELRLSTSEKQLGELRNQNTGLRFRLTESFDQLKNKSSASLPAGEQRVAFSAGLTDSGPVGPFDVETTLIFSKIITNIGNAYNATAGVFQAPVRGLYFFSFTAADYQKGYMGLHLYRNSQPITFNLDLNDHGGYASTSNSVALQLEAGDGVRLSLPASYRLYDDPRNFSVFSGFLLFPL